MAKTVIANSVISDAFGPSSSFTVSTDSVLVTCTKGEVVLQIEITTGVWLSLATLEADFTRPQRVSAGMALFVTTPHKTSTYRLATPNGKASGAVYELTA